MLSLQTINDWMISLLYFPRVQIAIKDFQVKVVAQTCQLSMGTSQIVTGRSCQAPPQVELTMYGIENCA